MVSNKDNVEVSDTSEKAFPRSDGKIPLLLRPNMSPLNPQFGTKFLDYYQKLTKGNRRLAKPLSLTVGSEELRGALKDVGVRSGARLAEILGLEKRQGGNVWGDLGRNLTARNILILQSWTQSRIRLCEDQLLPEEQRRNVYPGWLDPSRLDPPGGWTQRQRKNGQSDPGALKYKYETLLRLLSRDDWIVENQALARDEFMRRVAAEYTWLLTPTRLSALVTVGTMLLGDAAPGTAPTKGVDMCYLVAHLDAGVLPRFLAIVEDVIRAQPAEDPSSVFSEDDPFIIRMERDSWLITLRSALVSTHYGAEVSYSDLAKVVANPGGGAYWALNHKMEDGKASEPLENVNESDGGILSSDPEGLERQFALKTDLPFSWYPLEVLAEYSGLRDYA